MTEPPLEVLVIDPADTLGGIERALAAVDGAATVETASGPDAIVDQRPDIVVVTHDHDADIDGMKQLSMVRLRLPDTPVVVVARDPDAEVVSDAFDEGAADVITLPPGVTIDDDIPIALSRRLRYAAGMGGEFASDGELLDSLMEYLPHQVFIKDDRGRIAEASAVAAEEYGLTREQIIGLTDQELFPPEYARDLWEEEVEIMETESPIINRTENYTDERGSERWINVTKAPRYDSDDDVVGIIGTAVDVSEQKRQEQMVNALHVASRELVGAETREEIAAIVVEIADDIPDLPVVQVSLVDGDHVEPICTSGGDDRSSVFEAQEEWFQRAFDAGQSQFVHRSDDSSPTVRTEAEIEELSTFEPHVVTVPLGEHGVLGFGTTGGPLDEFEVDLADVLAANVETALSRMTHEEALRARERDLAEQNERLEEFAGIVSHDIRNPLSVAKGYLPQTDVDDEIKTEIRRSLDRMDALTNELLTLARKGQVVGETEPVPLDDVARTAWGGVSTDRATLTVVDEGATIAADRERLVELLENLFRNSVEHGSTSPDSRARQDAVEHSSTSPASQAQQDSVEHGSTGSRSQTDDAVEHGSTGPESQVTVRVGLSSDGFYVEDDGPGIPESERELVFDQGYTTAETGTGFGLYIVQTIAGAHGWSVSVGDAELAPTGARFEIDTSA